MFVYGKVVMVYPDRKVLDFLANDGATFIKDVVYTKLGINPSGLEITPMIDDFLIVSGDEYSDYKVEKFYARKEVEKYMTIQTQDDLKNKQIELPGDSTLFGGDGSFITVGLGNFLRMFATPLCQILGIGSENLMKVIAKNFDLISSGFRMMSINDNGKVITRFVFSGKDVNFTSGSQLSDVFEYQIDISEDGFSMIVGVSDGKKRVNKMMINIKENDGLSIVTGDDLENGKTRSSIYKAFDGTSQEVIFDKTGTVLYDKRMVPVNLGEPTLIVNEFIKGKVFRHIEGELTETVSGDVHKSQRNYYRISDFIDQTNSVIKNNNSGTKTDGVI